MDDGPDLNEGAASPPPKIKLGVRMRDVDGRATVFLVYDQTPAKSAGLRKGDVIETLDGATIAGTQEFLQRIRDASSGVTVRIGIRRVDAELEISVRLGN